MLPAIRHWLLLCFWFIFGRPLGDPFLDLRRTSRWRSLQARVENINWWREQVKSCALRCLSMQMLNFVMTFCIYSSIHLAWSNFGSPGYLPTTAMLQKITGKSLTDRQACQAMTASPAVLWRILLADISQLLFYKSAADQNEALRDTTKNWFRWNFTQNCQKWLCPPYPETSEWGERLLQWGHSVTVLVGLWSSDGLVASCPSCYYWVKIVIDSSFILVIFSV